MDNNNFLQQFYNDIDIFENNLDASYKQNTGSYYTNCELTNRITKDIINFFTLEELLNKKILEPCLGSGNYIYSFIINLYNLNICKKNIIKILNNIYVVDINIAAIDFYKIHLNMLLKQLYEIELDETYFSKHIGYNLIFNLYDNPIEYRSLNDTFPHIDFKFDIVMTNPPYKLIKLPKTNKKSIEIKDINKRYFPNCDTRNINLFKFFVEEIIKNYTNKNAIISILIPQTILKDNTCQTLRTYILSNCTIKKLTTISEKNEYIKANQALCNLLLTKQQNYDYEFVISNNPLDAKNETITSLQTILSLTNHNEILTCNNEGIEILKKISTFPKIKDFDFIKIFRGELDIDIHKSFITKEKTNYILIRGRNIINNRLQFIKNEYVSNDFATNSKKYDYIKKDRIVCQQISNINKEKRLNFAYCKKDYIIGNSCNFISIEQNNYEIDLYFMLAILNSEILNTIFKTFSSNNHINIYQLENLPIPIKFKNKKSISKLYKQYLKTNDKRLEKEIEILIRKAYECY